MDVAAMAVRTMNRHEDTSYLFSDTHNDRELPGRAIRWEEQSLQR
jgi:hypothetical protein